MCKEAPKYQISQPGFSFKNVARNENFKMSKMIIFLMLQTWSVIMTLYN